MRLGLVFALLALIAATHAVDIIVDDPFDVASDNGFCSLREAIIVANGGTANDCNDPGTDDPVVISLAVDVQADNLPTIVTDVEIVGGQTITGLGGNDGIFSIAATVGISDDVIVQNGNSIRNNTGGCFTVHAGGWLHLEGTIVRSCRADVGQNQTCAGAVFVDAHGGLSANNAEFRFNHGNSYGEFRFDLANWNGDNPRPAFNEDYNQYFCAGAVYMSANSSELIENSIFESNTGDGGGAIYSHNSLELQGLTLINNTAFPGSGGALMTLGSVDLNGNGDNVIIGNRAFEDGGAVFAERDIKITGYGDFIMNVAEHSGGVAASKFGSITAFDVGSVIENRAYIDGGAFFAGDGDVWIKNVAALQGNVATTGYGGVACGYEGTRLENSGEITGNRAGAGAIAYADDGFVTVVDVAGDISNNIADYYTSLVYGETGVEFQNVGSIHHNYALSTGGIVVSGSAVVVQNVRGNITYNHGEDRGDEAYFIYSEGLVVFENVTGTVAHNFGSGLIYSYFSIHIRNIDGLVDNHGTDDLGLIYTDDGGVLVESVRVIRDNAQRVGPLVYATEDLFIRNVPEGFLNNICDPFHESAYGCFYAAGGLDVHDIGPMMYNVGAPLLYGGTYVSVIDVAGDISNNGGIGAPAVAYAENSALLIRNVQGSMSENFGGLFNEGAILYADGGPIVLDNFDGGFEHNQGPEGFLIYAYQDLIIRDIASISGNHAYESITYSEETMELRNIRGSISNNTADADALFYCDAELVVDNIWGDISNNRCEDGPIFYADAEGSLSNVHGDISDNRSPESFGGLFYSEANLAVINIDGDIVRNFGQFLFYGDAGVLVRNVNGEVTDNICDGALFYSGASAMIENINGTVSRNIMGDSVSFFGIVTANGALVFRDINGPIADNYCDQGACRMFYADSGNILIEKVQGDISGNVAGSGLSYADSDGDIVIRDIEGSIRDNSAFEGEEAAVAYCTDGFVEISDIRGDITKNTHADGAIIYGDQGVFVFDLDGEISHNIVDVFNSDAPGVLYSEFGVMCRNISGGIHHNRGGSVIYGDTFVFLQQIGGDIADNYGFMSVVYSDNGGLFIQDVDGGILRNTAYTSSVFYSYDSEAGVEISDIRGDIAHNRAMNEEGSIFYTDTGATNVVNVYGDVVDNTSPWGLVYGAYGVKVENVGAIRENHATSTEAALFYSDSEFVIMRNVGEIVDNVVDTCALSYGDEYVLVENVRGGIERNIRTGQRDENTYGLFYSGSGSVVIREIDGPLSHNVIMDYAGIAYAELGVLIEEIGGDIADNSAHAFTIAYSESSMVQIRNLHGSIRNNYAGLYSLVYAESSGVTIENIEGGITDNRAGNDDSSGSLVYAYDGLVVHDIQGPISGNSAGGEGAVFYGYEDVTISFVYGDISHNSNVANGGASFAFADTGTIVVHDIHGDIYENWTQGSAGGLIYSDHSAELFNVFGDIYNNGCQGTALDCYGGILYGDDGASIRNVHGSIYNNQAGTGGVLYSSGGYATISEVAGDIVNNFAQFFGGVVYSEGSAEISYVQGSLNGNHVAEESGGVVYAEGNVHIYNIEGEIAYNSAGYDGSVGGVAYAYYGLVIESIGQGIHHNEAFYGGVAYSGDEQAAIRYIGGPVHDNIAFFHGGVGYAVETASLEFVSGSVYDNYAISGSGGVLYSTDSAVVITHIDGDVVANEAGFDFGNGGVAYADDSVFISNINGDLSRNRAQSGGVAYAYVNVEVHDIAGDIASNYANHFGGVAYSGQDLTIHTVEGDVIDNHSLINGGGVGFAISDAAISDIGGDVADNSAALNGLGLGGVLYAGQAASIRNVAESITGNHASEGGVMWAGFQNGEIERVGVDICDNYAAGHGGVIYSSGDAIISKVERYICSNAAHNGNGGVIYADEDGEIAEAGLGICQNEAFVHGGVIFSYDGDVTIHGDSTKVTLNEARTGFGGVGFVNNENNSTARGAIDVGSGYVTGNSDAFSADPFSLVGRNVTGMPLHLDFQGAALPGNVDLIVEFSGSDGVANEFITPGPVVNVTSFEQGIELDFVVNVEVDGLPAYYYETEDLDVEVLPYGLYQFHNIKLPSGSYRLKFQVVTGCGSGAVIAESEYTSVFDVAACQDPRPIQCPTDVIVAESDAFTCGAFVVVDDIIADPDCDTAEFSNDYNSVTVNAGEDVDGSASDVYPVGSTEVLLTVSTSGLDLSCPVQIVVEDVRPFTSMTCPFPIEVDTEAGLCSAEVTVPQPTALDNCPVLFTNDFNNLDDASGRYPGGRTRVEFTGYNFGPSSVCETTVRVTDREAPVITCPADITATCEENDVWFQVLASDNCIDVDVYPVLHDVSPLGGVLPAGVNRLVYEAADAEGNTAQCSFVTTVRSTYYRDADGDGYGDAAFPREFSCDPPAGWVLDNTDCNDFSADAFKLWFIDFDGDGFGDPSFPICTDETGAIPESFLNSRRRGAVAGNNSTTNSTTPAAPTGPFAVPGDEVNAGSFDCDDTNPFVNPAAPEICDGIDNNCNNQIDEGLENCPLQGPHVIDVPTPVPVDNPIPIPVENPIPVPVPVDNPVPVPVPVVVTVPADDVMQHFSFSASSASVLSASIVTVLAAVLAVAV